MNKTLTTMTLFVATVIAAPAMATTADSYLGKDAEYHNRMSPEVSQSYHPTNEDMKDISRARAMDGYESPYKYDEHAWRDGSKLGTRTEAMDRYNMPHPSLIHGRQTSRDRQMLRVRTIGNE